MLDLKSISGSKEVAAKLDTKSRKKNALVLLATREVIVSYYNKKDQLNEIERKIQLDQVTLEQLEERGVMGTDVEYSKVEGSLKAAISFAKKVRKELDAKKVSMGTKAKSKKVKISTEEAK